MYGYNLDCQLYNNANKKVIFEFKAREMSPKEKNAAFESYIASGGQRYGIVTFEQLPINVKELSYNYNIIIDNETYKIIIANSYIKGFNKNVNANKAIMFMLE